jgi:hypothetical protein
VDRSGGNARRGTRRPEARAKAIEILARVIAQSLATSTQPQNEMADE